MFDCGERIFLLTAYEKAAEAFFASIVQLATARHEVNQPLEHDKFRLIAQWAEQASLNANSRLNVHIAEHG